MFCMAVSFTGSQANTQQLNTSVRPGWKYCSQPTVQAMDSWVDRKGRWCYILINAVSSGPYAGGGGGGQGPLMEEVHLWVNGSAYRSLNMIGVCVQYTFSILYVHNAQDWGSKATSALFSYAYGLWCLWSAPTFHIGPEVDNPRLSPPPPPPPHTFHIEPEVDNPPPPPTFLIEPELDKPPPPLPQLFISSLKLTPPSFFILSLKWTNPPPPTIHIEPEEDNPLPLFIYGA